ncbi:hypothetical protein BH09PSE1_BH09PSE1_06910 [soil metagenome]
MKYALILAAASAALLTSACGTTAKPAASTVAAATPAWRQTEGAKPFDTARTECWAVTQGAARNGAFAECMAGKGWTRG